MLLVFLECVVIGYSYEELECYILATSLGSSAVVKVPIHLTGFLSECDRTVQVCQQEYPIYEAWIGNRLQLEVGEVSC